MSENEVLLKPIGSVRTKLRGEEVRDRSLLSKIVVNQELVPALDGIVGYSRIFILYWLHETTEKERKMLKIHPRGNTNLPLVGVFAARSRCRPNPIGLTLCELVSIDGNVLTVRGLDAYDGTSVLDIKPYDLRDCEPNAKMPEWWIALEKESEERRQKQC